MDESDNLRPVEYADPQQFLDATKNWDDSFMNFCLGSVHHHVKRQDGPQCTQQTVHMFALFRADELLIALTRIPNDFSWYMGIPRTALETLERTPDLLASATSELAQSLLTKLPDPLSFDKVIGHKDAVNLLYTTYCSLLPQRGIRVSIDYGVYNVKDSYATRASLPSLSYTTRSSPHTIVPATMDDLEAVAHLYIAFQRDAPWHGIVSHEQALAVVTEPVTEGFVWVCRVDGAVAAYLMLGRATPRTIAVRNVFVAQEHRRKGIAEALVQTVTRYCLGVSIDGVEGVPPGPPPFGVKEEVGLNVEDLGAARIYKRAGYLLPDLEGSRSMPTGGIDPETGRKGWTSSVCWSIKAETTDI
ncbi:hypothetical protein C8Q80DRAFT_1112121 [Daedaleopsis nitida]|nr:hypothetical protein C8Q80DRAFT_1112121 [Daedaleopsis nitida]